MPRMLARVAVLAAVAAGMSACADNPLAVSGTPAPAAKTSAKAPASAAATQPAQQQKTAAIANAVAAAPTISLEAELARAKTLRAQGKYAEATRSLGQLVLVAPDDARVIGEYGKVLVQQQGRSDDAIAFLKRAIALNGSDASLYSALGVAYDQADDAKDAKAAYDKALAIHPGDPAVLNNYAVSRMLAGDLDGAQMLLAQARAAGAADPKVASNLQLLAQMRSSKMSAAPAQRSAAAAAAAQKPAGQIATAMPARTGVPTGPKNLVPGTMAMQQVPGDSHAGTAHRTSTSTHKVAASGKSKPAKTALAKSEVPALRTAD